MSMGLSSRRQHPDLRGCDIAFKADNAGIWTDHCHNLTGGQPARMRHTRHFPQKLTPVAVPPCVSAFLRIWSHILREYSLRYELRSVLAPLRGALPRGKVVVGVLRAPIPVFAST
jgi:hypothetical protein